MKTCAERKRKKRVFGIWRFRKCCRTRTVFNAAYAYDALNRPTTRNADAFGYNDRSEVTSATICGIASTYGYDEIGNSSSFAANNLNQYTEFSYDLDGNLLSDGVRTFTSTRYGIIAALHTIEDKDKAGG